MTDEKVFNMLKSLVESLVGKMVVEFRVNKVVPMSVKYRRLVTELK